MLMLKLWFCLLFLPGSIKAHSLELATTNLNQARAFPYRVFVTAVHNVFINPSDGTDDVGAATAPAPLATPIPFGPHISVRPTPSAAGESVAPLCFEVARLPTFNVA